MSTTYDYCHREGTGKHLLERGFLLLFLATAPVGITACLAILAVQSVRARIRAERRLKARRLSRDFSKPAPLHPAPSAQAISEQWNRVRDGLGEVVKFGGMLLDLETAVDNSFHYGENGRIVAREPGIKGFLADNCPQIGYKTAMRYRSIAKKIRRLQTIGTAVPKSPEALRKLRARRLAPSAPPVADAIPAPFSHCKRIGALRDSLDRKLRIPHAPLRIPRRTARRAAECEAARRLQRGISSARLRARETFRRLGPAQRSRYLDAVSAILGELRRNT